MITFRHKGDFSKTKNYLLKSKRPFDERNLEKYGQRGVAALMSATPQDSGITAYSWYYTVESKAEGVTIAFYNSNIQNGVPIAIILQYGHATGTGGYVQGRDYINPVIRPIFDEIVEAAWKEVKKT